MQHNTWGVPASDSRLQSSVFTKACSVWMHRPWQRAARFDTLRPLPACIRRRVVSVMPSMSPAPQPDLASSGTPASARVPARRARQIKARLLERVADADLSHLTVADSQGDWHAFGEGIRIKPLRERDGVLSYLLRLAPGASLPAHRHPIDEECVVLQGRLRVGSQLEIGPGAYHLAHQGALHARISSVEGAVLFLRGAVPLAEHALA